MLIRPPAIVPVSYIAENYADMTTRYSSCKLHCRELCRYDHLKHACVASIIHTQTLTAGHCEPSLTYSSSFPLEHRAFTSRLQRTLSWAVCLVWCGRFSGQHPGFFARSWMVFPSCAFPVGSSPVHVVGCCWVRDVGCVQSTSTCG